MDVEPHQLHIAFFPLMAPGHSIPIIDIIRLLDARHVRTTIITTPLNASNFTKSLNGINNICIETFPFPSKEMDLPQGIENLDQLTSPEMVTKFMHGIHLFSDPLDKFLERTRPHCLVADMFFPFATEVAAKFGIPRIVFHGMSFFALCAMVILLENKPYRTVSSDDEPFVLLNLPHEIKLTRLQISVNIREEKNNGLILAASRSETKSFGVIVNSFYELEPDYADYYRKVLGRRAWHIGPVSLCNQDLDFEKKCHRGKKASVDENECLKWLDSKEPSSVIYVCFGSWSKFSPSQLHEIAQALEASGQKFIWVVKKYDNEERERENWLPEGFEKRMDGKGIIIRGWAPQVLILNHQTIGGFLTHCGWNSILEGISAGVPMVTWPIFSEQFVNEKLVTEILKIGVPVGSKQWSLMVEGMTMKWEEIDKALKLVMVGEEALEMKRRARKLKELSRKAVGEGGSSHSDLSALLEELSFYHNYYDWGSGVDVLFKVDN